MLIFSPLSDDNSPLSDDKSPLLSKLADSSLSYKDVLSIEASLIGEVTPLLPEIRCFVINKLSCVYFEEEGVIKIIKSSSNMGCFKGQSILHEGKIPPPLCQWKISLPGE